ncbi:unnamed protein product [Trichobilharzia szidati]|nr:unnamed protein product [Trichobilharzia szidati]
MSTGAYHHAIILSPAVYARQCYPDNVSNDSSYWKHEDAARHLSNHIMNKYPNLNVLCLSNSTYLKNELWTNPTRINACLFSQASRIVLFIPDDGSEHITYFTRHCLQPLLCNSREEGGRPEWHSRFVAVAIGNVQVPNQLNSETPFINVIRFREIGWFRDIMGMMLLERAIKEFWIPPEMKELTKHNNNSKQSNMVSIKYSLNEVVETTSVVGITTHVTGKIDLDEFDIPHSRQRSKSPPTKKQINHSEHENGTSDHRSRSYSSRYARSSSRSHRRLIKPEFEAEQLQENILEARLFGSIGQVVPVTIKNKLTNGNVSAETNGYVDHDLSNSIKTVRPLEPLKIDVRQPSPTKDLNIHQVLNSETNNTNLQDDTSPLQNKNDSCNNLLNLDKEQNILSGHSVTSDIEAKCMNITSDLETSTKLINEITGDRFKPCLNYDDIPLVDAEVINEIKQIPEVTTTSTATSIPTTSPTTPSSSYSPSDRSRKEVHIRKHKITHEETFTSRTETTKTTTSSISRVENDYSTSKTTDNITINKTRTRSGDDNDASIEKGEHTAQGMPENSVKPEEDETQRSRYHSGSSSKPVRIIHVSRTKSGEHKSRHSSESRTNESVRTVSVSPGPRGSNRSATTSRSNSTSPPKRKGLRSAVGSPSRFTPQTRKSLSPCNKRIVRIYSSTPFGKLCNMLSDAYTQMISPLATGDFSDQGTVCFALTGIQYRQKVDTNGINNTSNDNDKNLQKSYSSLAVSKEMNVWTGPDSAETYRLELLLSSKVLREPDEPVTLPPDTEIVNRRSITLLHSDNQTEELSHRISSLGFPDRKDIDESDYMTWQLLGVFAFTFVTLMLSLTVAFICLDGKPCNFPKFVKHTLEFFKRK